jgi:hypothetical protein
MTVPMIEETAMNSYMNPSPNLSQTSSESGFSPRSGRRTALATLGCALSAALLPVGMASASDAPLVKPLAQWLVGAWMLESFTSTDEKGIVTEAMGPGATGYIAYGADGWMSVQIMRAGRKPYAIPDLDGGTPEQIIDAAKSYFAYSGPYTIDEPNRVVFHHLALSLMPNWVGGKQKRYVKVINDDLMELSGDPVLIAGKTQVTRLRWRRRSNGQ